MLLHPDTCYRGEEQRNQNQLQLTWFWFWINLSKVEKSIKRARVQKHPDETQTLLINKLATYSFDFFFLYKHLDSS